MPPQPLETDYLVVGAGASAMAFVDTLLDHSDASVTIVDRRDSPGGHWNDAYPFVRLHQPTSWYGVVSQALPETWDAGASSEHRATGAEVLAYFNGLMQERFLPSGRVTWLPGVEYVSGDDGLHRVNSVDESDESLVTVRRKVVDATHARTEVPAIHPPKYALAAGVQCVAPNRLPDLELSFSQYTVVGSGKTGMDACLWLLDNGVEVSRIRWIRPRDAWLQDRANMQPGISHFRALMGQFQAIAEVANLAELFRRLEAESLLCRINESVQPTAFRCAIVSRDELARLRSIDDVVRLGRVRSIERTRISLDLGSVPAIASTLYIDCSAGALQHSPPVPVFDGKVINLLYVLRCRPLPSAAVIAYVESHFEDEAEKNLLCTPVGVPERPSDWLAQWSTTLNNMAQWAKHPAMNGWFNACRLSSTAIMMRDADAVEASRLGLLKESSLKAGAAAPRLRQLIADGQ